MGVTLDIPRAWVAPRRVMARRLAGGVREDQALIYLMAGCFIVFVAQWPRLLIAARLDPGTPFQARISGALWAWLFIAPLAFYAISALSHLLARAVGGAGSWFGARMALFWALLAAAPMWLANGAVLALLGRGMIYQITGLLGLLGFLAIWLASLVEAEKGAR